MALPVAVLSVACALGVLAALAAWLLHRHNKRLAKAKADDEEIELYDPSA